MGQTRWQSFWEAWQNIIIGVVVSFFGTKYFTFPMQDYWMEWFGNDDSVAFAAVVTLFFTVVSFARMFIIRRWHNHKLTASSKHSSITAPTDKE